MKKAFLCLVPMLLLAFDVHAQQRRMHADMLTTEEVPAISGSASGHVEFLIAGDDSRIDFVFTYGGLTAPPLFAHVHIGQHNVNGGVSFFFCGGGTKPPCPAATSGSVTGTVVPGDVIGPLAQGVAAGDLAAVIAMMRAGLTYSNMHTPAHPGGEIRGQNVPGLGN